MTSANAPLNRKLRMALIGGGGAAFIGRVHATAAQLDNRAELVAGAFSSDPDRSRTAAPEFGVAAERAYGSIGDLMAGEMARPADDRIDLVSIATPNFTHFPIAQAALKAGLNVVCDKPMTISLDDARNLAELVEQSGAVFVLTHNYSGYPLVRQARAMIAAGELGEIQAVRANYLQGWMRLVDPHETPARGAWKNDPVKNGPAGTLADVGTHAFQLVRYITDLRPTEIASQLRTFQGGSQLDDYGQITLRMGPAAIGSITVSQVSHGRLNDLSIEVDGTTGSLAWRQEEPNVLIVRRQGRPRQIYERDPNADYLQAAGKAACRLPSGHPEAFFEAFANVYRAGFDDMIRRAAGDKVSSRGTIYPNVHDGVEGVQFIHACLASHRDNGAWTVY